VTKEIILIRHGTTVMNEHLAKKPWGSDHFVDANFFDTRLSPRGIAGATALNEKIIQRDPAIGVISRIECLVSSPLTRALHTADLAFKGVGLGDDVPRIALPLARERTYLSSEVGRTRTELAAEFPGWDLSLLGGGVWWYAHPEDREYTEWRPKGTYACLGEPADVFSSRMRLLRGWLAARPEKVICLVCHWGVARALTGVSFENCDFKSFALADLLDEPFIDH
jgi:broad specificity phosphatase PhoE